MDDIIHSSFTLSVGSTPTSVRKSAILPTAQDGNIAASCSSPAFAVAANKNATRTAILTICIAKFSDGQAFAKKTITGELLAKNMTG
jgi:hypothetical protein